MSLFIGWFIISFLLVILALVQIFIGESKLLKWESLSPLESGFESLKASSIISTPFFFLAVIFVLFDLELVLLFPGVLQVSVIFSWMWSITMVVVLITLLLEWVCCGLKWQV